MVEAQEQQNGSQPSRKPTQKELEAEFDKLAQFLFDLYKKTKQASLQK